MKTDDLMSHWLREVSGRTGAWTILGDVLTAMAPDGAVPAADRLRAVTAALSNGFRQHLPYLAWMADDRMSEARAALRDAGVDPRTPRGKGQYLGWGRDGNRPDGQAPLAAAIREGSVEALAQALQWWSPHELATPINSDRRSWRISESASWLSHALESGQWQCADLIWSQVKSGISQDELDRALFHLAGGLFLGSHRGSTGHVSQMPLRGQDPGPTAGWIDRLLDAGANPNVGFELAGSSSTEFLAGPYTGDEAAIEAAGWTIVRNRSHYVYTDCVTIESKSPHSATALGLLCSSANYECPVWWIQNIRVSPDSRSGPDEETLAVLRSDLTLLRQSIKRVWDHHPELQKSARQTFVRSVCAHAFASSHSSKELEFPAWVSEGWQAFTTAELFGSDPGSPHAPIIDLFGGTLRISARVRLDAGDANAMLTAIMAGRETEVGPEDIVALTVRALAVGCEERLDAQPFMAQLLVHQDPEFQSRFREWNDQREAMKQERIASEDIDGYTQKSKVQSDIDARRGLHEGMLPSLAIPLAPPRPRM